MKTIAIISFLLSANLSLGFVSDDTVHFNMGTTEFIIIDKSDSLSDGKNTFFDSNDSIFIDDEQDLDRFGGLWIGINGYLSAANSFGLPSEYADFEVDYSPRSINFNWNIIGKRFELGTPHVGLNTGLGLEFNRYELKRNVSLLYNGDSVWSAMPDSASGITYKKNFLKATYLQVPLILDFTTSKFEDKGFYLGVGVIGGYRIGSKMKVKYESEGDKYKEKISGHYNLNPFKLSATARIGFGKLTLFANYGLTSLFEKNKGPEVYPVSFGISLTSF